MTTWTPKAKEVEPWTAEAIRVRVFDPAVFENSPIFDTGKAGGFWTPGIKQSEVWVPL